MAAMELKKRSVGNIKFIGELFKVRLLSDSIIHECIRQLLDSTAEGVALECFGTLITTVGKDLDKPENWVSGCGHNWVSGVVS